MGKILRVDLTTGTLRDDLLPEEPMLRKLWGGQLLAEYILLHELPVGVEEYSPDSVIVGMTGPITGTGFTPGGTKLCVVYLSPVTRYTLGRGATSGFLGTAIKAAGYDGFIITGAAQRPTYLYLNDGQVELRDASRVWGKGTRETEDQLRAEVGRQDARVGCIGPAGEHLIRAAMLVNDYNHTAAHGLGAVMGSKNLKAIVAWGTRRPQPYDRTALIAAGDRWRVALRPRVYSVRAKKTSVGHGEHLGKGGLTKLNWRSTLIADEARGLDQNDVQLRPCFQCSRMCPWDVTIGEGRHLGKVGHFNAGSEWLDSFYNVGFKGNDVLYLSERINDLGIECSHFACAAGLAFEAWEKGVLGPERTDGLKLEWGNLEAAEALLERCARREGWLGNLLADGPKDLAEALGGDAPNWVVHTKGGTPAQHEWRPLLGQMLRELVASGGMKPQGAGGPTPPPDLRYRETWGPLDPLRPEGWARSHFVTEQVRQACGMMGGCWFALNESAPDGVQSMVDSLCATTGWDVSLDETLDAGLRSILLQSLFGTQRGWKPEHDWTDVGARFLEPIPDGPHKGFTIARFLPDLINEYHELSGRDPVTGRPYRNVLQRLGLTEFLDWSEPDAD
jgi:aldehyde:ferredoxin oxidoreductase